MLMLPLLFPLSPPWTIFLTLFHPSHAPCLPAGHLPNSGLQLMLGGWHRPFHQHRGPLHHLNFLYGMLATVSTPIPPTEASIRLGHKGTELTCGRLHAVWLWFTINCYLSEVSCPLIQGKKTFSTTGFPSLCSHMKIKLSPFTQALSHIVIGESMDNNITL